ncbi:MAG: 23S rRNA (guanosine(2251)-2'-O)-methyltransferase RlmB [Thermomicrobiales bacterium]|nr:23S rRNA (guanosine(2251)-2'-O)-methyltransferase RlmB [Thermomicrobiales bacterium]
MNCEPPNNGPWPIAFATVWPRKESPLRTDRPLPPGARSDRGATRGPRPEPVLRQGEELIYGRNGVAEALRGRRSVRRLFVAAGVKEDSRVRDAISAAGARGINVERLDRRALDEMTGGVNHQGLALVSSSYRYASLEEILERDGTVLIMDHLQDPQNLGTLIRAADAASVAGIIIPRDRAAEITPAVVNASAGAVEHVLIAQEANLVRAIEALKKHGRWVLALDTGDRALDLYRADLPLPAALVVGSEGSGVTPIVRKACDLIVAIPMSGKVASLNAATAGSIALFELVRRSQLPA